MYLLEIITTELKDIKDLIKASRNISSTVVAYRFGEIRVYRGLAYIVTSLGRNHWYVLYTKNHNLDDKIEFIEFTVDEEIKTVSSTDVGRDSRAIYFAILRPIRDEIIEPLIEKLRKE